jgi:hypothetical protein
MRNILIWLMMCWSICCEAQRLTSNQGVLLYNIESNIIKDNNNIPKAYIQQNKIYTSQHIFKGQIFQNIIYNNNFQILGYISNDGSVKDKNYNILGYVYRNTIYDNNSRIIGYYNNVDPFNVALFHFFFKNILQ